MEAKEALEKADEAQVDWEEEEVREDEVELEEGKGERGKCMRTWFAYSRLQRCKRPLRCLRYSTLPT